MKMIQIAGIAVVLLGVVACGDDSGTVVATEDAATGDDSAMMGKDSSMMGEDSSMMDDDSSMGMACGLSHESEMFADVCGGDDFDQMLLQKMASLSWVNGVNGCHTKANLADNENIMDDTLVGAAKFCDELNYGGQDDWRLPTQDELTSMITGAVTDKVTLNYINPNCQALAAVGGFVQTENTADPGKQIDNFGNFGVRCVREVNAQ